MKISAKFRLGILLFFTLLLADTVRAEVATDSAPDANTAANAAAANAEMKYSEAVVMYHRKKFPDALKLLQEVVAANPNDKKAFELQALIFKSSGKLPEAYTAYDKLLKLSQKSNVPKADQAPYMFELGMIRYQQKKNTEARTFFDAALAENFNKTVATYFLGMIDFQEKKLPRAKERFNQVIQSNVADLKAPAHLYLGQISAQESDIRGTVTNLVVARNLALDSQKGLPDRSPASLSNPILNSASEALKYYDQGGYWGSVGLMTGYDTNVLLNPTATVSATGASGNASFKETLQIGLGYASSPVKRTQFIPSYRGTVNYNFNQVTKTGQFSTHNLGLQIARDPLDKVSFGLKVEGFVIFRVAADGTTSAGKFAPYSLFASAGPYFRIEQSKYNFVGMEFFAQPQIFFGDSETEDRYKNTGWRGQMRLYYRKEQPGKTWNPGVALGIEMNLPTTGTEFKSKGATIEFSNYFNLNKTTQLSLVAQTGAFIYDSRPDGYRGDFFFSGMSGAQYLLTQNIILMANLQYIANLSSIKDTYQYTRLQASVGGAYAF